MALKDKKKKKKPRPRRLGSKPFVPVFKTGMNRDIPLGGAGGSQNLIANLLASRQAQPSAQVIQTPDQFKLAQDIKAIKVEQAAQAEDIKVERKKRWDAGLTIAERDYERIQRAARAAEEKAATTGEKRQRNEDMSKTQAQPGQKEPAGNDQYTPFKEAGRTINKSAGGAVKGKDSGMDIDRSGSPPTYL
jgi:hypothetical protein